MTESDKIAATLDILTKRGSLTWLSSTEIKSVARSYGITFAKIHSIFLKDSYKVGRGKFTLTSMVGQTFVDSTNEKVIKVKSAKKAAFVKTAPAFELTTKPTPKITSISSGECFVPDVDPTFIAWGDYKTIRKIIEARMFFPVYISGMSGNGKSLMCEQACAKLKREYIRVQISPETDSDMLLGGFRLINGETVFHKGPVVKAMEAGAILLIDELDRGSNKIMCLQGVLEGKPILIPQTGEMIIPQPGFNVIATANTKGRGSDDGRYSAANIIDEAFIERFVATIDQPFPGFKIERNIVAKHMEAYGVNDEEFTDKLVSWASVIRKTYDAEGVDELISTRRLCHIVKAYSVFQDRLASISMCIARFEAETREAFLDLYTKIDSGVIKADADVTEVVTDLDTLQNIM